MKPSVKITSSMLIFGTIGIFVQYIPLSSPMLACLRAVIGTAFLACVLAAKKMPLHAAAIRRNGLLLALSGTAIGVNWIFLFESYHYTTVAVATLCYYMAPVFVTVLSPLLLRERLTARQAVLTAVAVAGAALVSGASVAGGGDVRGVLFALAAALLYASVILMNKRLGALEAMEKTICQLGAAAVVMLLYVALRGEFAGLTMDGRTVLLVLTVGVVHTGIAYWLFFSGVGGLSAQAAALLSYIDPVTAVLLSALLLHQPMTAAQAVGAVLVLGAAVAGEIAPRKRH